MYVLFPRKTPGRNADPAGRSGKAGSQCLARGYIRLHQVPFSFRRFLWQRGKRPQAGATLIEVVCAVGLLSIVLVPMLRFTDVAQGTAMFQRQMTAMMADIQIEEYAATVYRTSSWPAPSSGSKTMGQLTFTVTPTLEAYTPPAGDAWAYSNQLRKLTVTVQCTNCASPMPTVKKVAIIAKAQ